MRYSRIFGVLDTELGRDVAFTFCIDEHLTRPGSTALQLNDALRISVWVGNNSAIPIKQIEGLISPSTSSLFEPLRFTLSHLRPRKKKKIATFEARIVRNPGRGLLKSDRIGMVKCSISADLSRFRFEKSRPLHFVRSA